MGNDIRKDSSSDLNSSVNSEKWEDIYAKLISESNIIGSTWEELAENLSKHIEETTLIDKEWEYLQRKDDLITRNEFLFTAALQPANKAKNRYLNILPYDTTRVKLTVADPTSTDFINANWVKSGERTYICTQAPLEHTVDDFYKMLWETNTRTIVMLTRFAELGRIKAHDYLPRLGEGKTKFGEIEAEILSEEPSKDETYLIRKIKISKGTETHNIIHFHFISWPDHGVPEISEPLLDMAIIADQLTPPTQDTPTVVHCSAGVGRTGTYVIINSILEIITNHMKLKPNTPPIINMAKTLHDLRSMRSGLVNHIDQYVFCYKTILSHVQHLIKQRNDGKKPEKPEKT